jgi:hypothetical protein
MKRHLVSVSIAIDLYIESLAQGIHDRSANTVQPTRCGIGAATEFASGVQLGEDYLYAGESRLWFDVNWDAAGLVAHLDRTVGVEVHLNAFSVPSQRLINRVVDNFPKAMHESATIGATDVHARPLTNGFKTL